MKSRMPIKLKILIKDKQAESQNQSSQTQTQTRTENQIFSDLKANLDLIKEELGNSSDITTREFQAGENGKIRIIYGTKQPSQDDSRFIQRSVFCRFIQFITVKFHHIIL